MSTSATMSVQSLLFLILLFNFTQCHNILAIFNAPSKSHTILGVKLAEGLIKKGHHVTLASPFLSDPIKGLTQIHLKSISDFKDRMSQEVGLPNGRFQLLLYMKNFFEEVTNLFWQEPGIQKIIEEKPQFDVVIMLGFFNDAALGIAHHLGVPTIFFSSVGSGSFINHYFANPNMVYVPNIFLSVSTDNFLGRLFTVTANALLCSLGSYFINTHQQAALKKYLPDAPPLEDLQKNISLMLVNSHFSIEPPRPHVPNVIQIGGFHLDETKKLPEEIKTFLDNAEQGAILFSMGTNVLISVIEEEKRQAIFKVLGELAPIKILFKSELHHENLPGNIMVKKWLPQADILAHRNIRVFISHGGLGGNTEAVYHGVPMVGIPFFGDQKMNIDEAKSAGYAVVVEYEHLTEDLLRSRLKEVLQNSSYRENAKKRSTLLKGQLFKPMDNAAFWIEHIIKYGSGSHLRNAGMDLSWYQLYMVDIYIFYTVSFGLISLTIYHSIKMLLSCFRRRNNIKIKKS